MTTQEQWLCRAAACELLAFSLRLPTPELAEALISGEFAEALRELGEKNGLEPAALASAAAALQGYREEDGDALFHALRREYTRLFVGAPQPLVSPYAGIWYAREQGVEPLMFVSTRAMEIERFLRKYGVGQAEGKNEPLDHIATEFEFLQYLALVNAGAVEVAKDINIAEDTFHTFFSNYVANWAGSFAQSVAAASELAFYQTVAAFLDMLTKKPGSCWVGAGAQARVASSRFKTASRG